jgi:outer membrane protein
MKKFILIFIISLAPITGVMAQKYTFLNYSMGIPSEDLKDFIGEVSFRGIDMGYISFVDSNISVGFSVGWNVFYERRAQDSFTYNNTTLTSNQYRYTNSVPLFLYGNYHFNPGSIASYYAGLGVGTIYSDRTVDFGVYRYSVDTWALGLAPQIGVIYELNDNTNLHIGGRYNFSFDTSELDGQNYFAVNVGFAWRIW